METDKAVLNEHKKHLMNVNMLVNISLSGGGLWAPLFSFLNFHVFLQVDYNTKYF